MESPRKSERRIDESLFEYRRRVLRERLQALAGPYTDKPADELIVLALEQLEARITRLEFPND